jgi:hypothetical protein
MSKSKSNSKAKSQQETAIKPDPISNERNVVTRAGETSGAGASKGSKSSDGDAKSTSKSSSSESSSSESKSSNKRKVIMPEVPAVTRRKELEELSDKDLDELYFNTFGKEANEHLDQKTKIDQIESQLPEPPKALPRELVEKANPTSKAELKRTQTTVFTSSQTGKEFKMTGDLSGHVVVRQVSVKQENGGMYEVPNTETVQTYYKDQFDKLVEDGFFSESKLKIEVLQEA